MDTKIVIVILALIGIGIFALPSTVALFSGQHTFTNIDPTGNQIDCKKCHGDVQAELDSSMSTLTGTPGAHAAFKCEYCHRIEAGASSGDNAYSVAKYIGTDGSMLLVAVNLIDMESNKLPPTIPYNVNGSLFKELGGLFGGASVSPQEHPNYTGNYMLSDLSDIRVYPTYNVTTNTPRDTNPLTMNSGFDVSKITWIGFTQNLTGAGSRTVNPGTKYHAASTVSCMECHGNNIPIGHYSRVSDKGAGNCKDCHYGSVPSISGNCANCHASGNHHAAPKIAFYGCTGCHSGVHGGQYFFVTECAVCHSGIPFPGNPTVISLPIPHHNNKSDCKNCHVYKDLDLYAGGFGLTGAQGDTGAIEAHNKFVKTNDGITRFEYGASNGACIACHTHVEVDIKYSKPSVYQFDSNFFSGGNESVGGFGAQAPMITSYSSNNSTPR